MKKKIFVIIFAFALIFSSAIFLSAENTYAEGEKTFVLKKADGTELGQYDEIKDGWDENTILGMMKKTDKNASYVIEVTKDYEFEGTSRSIISGLNITFTSKEGTSPVLTSGNGMPHFFLKDGNYLFKNIILEGKDGSTGGGIYTHDDNQGITITLDKGTVIRNCNYVDAPYSYRTLVIRDEYNDGKDSTLIINDGVTIENNKLNSQNGGSPISVRENCKLIVNGGEFKNNESQYNRTGGGVIFNEEGAETIINGGNFEGNKAEGYGGAIINYGKLTVNKGTFKGNEASNGGAICSLADNNVLIVNGGIFENNKITGTLGGAIVADNKVSIENANFVGNASVKVKGKGGAIFVRNSNNASIKNNTFNNNTAKFGGALFVTNVEGIVERNTFEGNFAERFSSAFHVKDSSVSITSNIFKNNGKNEDKLTSAGTLMVESVKNNEVIEANGNTFENNAAGLGGAAVVQAGTVDFNGCSFNKNNSAEYGGAMYITKNATVNITNSKFEENSAKRGGAIVTELFSQANPAEKEKYANLTIADDVVFDKNFASDGYFNPPTNYKDFQELKFETTSLMGKLRAIKSDMTTYEKVDSLLNNYDVYYVNPLVTVIYDSNGGNPAEKIYGEELKSENDKIKPANHIIKTIKETGLTREGLEFKGWNTQADGKGTAYKAGDKIDVSSNQILYAIWGEKTPSPTPKPEPQPEPKPETKPEAIPEIKIHEYVETFPVFAQADSMKVPEKLSESHIEYISGYPDETVRADCNVTRAEAVTMLVRLKAYPLTEGEEIFKDVKANAWYAPFISAAYKNNILEEKKGQAFRPDEKITRAELAQLISHLDKKNNAKATFPDIAGHKYEAAINQSFGNDRISGYPDGSFKPDNAITRAETARILNSLFDRKVNEKGLAKVMADLRLYKDLDKSHWAYYEIIEASHTHQYERMENGFENWTSIIK
ncbi:S-layer homology domain-containing protein [Peptoniphilus senegalensis]|uniref:S-layer homology domain-containing protein n=1 Tax=Peptoniphilus senegalensis TaxID=1465757 RepID=UPI0002F5BCFE|nr:S-layer homology domain-containing protein [Peptoniphilus senegalensis]